MSVPLAELYHRYAPDWIQDGVASVNNRVVQPIQDAMQPALEVTAEAINPAMRLMANFLEERVRNPKTSKIDHAVGTVAGALTGAVGGTLLDSAGIHNIFINTFIPVIGVAAIGYNATRLAANAARRIHSWSDGKISPELKAKTAEYTTGPALKHAGQTILTGLKDGAHEVSVKAKKTGQAIGQELKVMTHSASGRIINYLDQREELSSITRKRLALAGGLTLGAAGLAGAAVTMVYGVPDIVWYKALGATGWVSIGVAATLGMAYVDKVATYAARQIHELTAPKPTEV